MAKGTFTIHFDPITVEISDFDTELGEALANADVKGLASKEELADVIKSEFEEGGSVAEHILGEAKVSKIELSPDAECDGIEED